MNFLQTFALVMLAVTLCYGDDHKYCGQNLARAMAMYCSKGNVGKRSEGTMYNSVLSPYYKDQEEPDNGLLWPNYKARALSLPSRGKRLIVDECCNKPCSINELLSYCYFEQLL